MFSASRNQSNSPSEKDVIQNFIKDNYEFQQMKRIAKRTGYDKFIKHIAWIERIDNFYDLELATCHLDANRSDSLLVHSISRNKLNALSFIGGYFSDGMNLAYYELHFREKAQKIAHEWMRQKWSGELFL